MSDATTWTNLLLQKQGMQAEADQAAEKLKTQQIRDMLSAGMGAASSISGAMRQEKLDGIANSLMNEADPIPRATSDDPAMQDQANKAAAKMPGFHTGGTDEMRLSMAMDDQKLKQMAMSLRQGEAGEMSSARAEMARNRAAQEARASFQAASEDLRKGTLDAQATFKNLNLMRKDLIGAQTQDEYDSIAGDMAAIVSGAQSAGVPGIGMPQLPPFVPPAQRALAGAAAAAAAMRTQGLGSMPGYSLDRDAAPPVSSGQIIVNPKTGERKQWNGSEWVPAK